jgi:hypothetical protein
VSEAACCAFLRGSEAAVSLLWQRDIGGRASTAVCAQHALPLRDASDAACDAASAVFAVATRAKMPLYVAGVGLDAVRVRYHAMSAIAGVAVSVLDVRSVHRLLAFGNVFVTGFVESEVLLDGAGVCVAAVRTRGSCAACAAWPTPASVKTSCLCACACCELMSTRVDAADGAGRAPLLCTCDVPGWCNGVLVQLVCASARALASTEEALGVWVLGGGGGTVPMHLHSAAACLGDVCMDVTCVELDAVVAAAAEKWFPPPLDDGCRVTCRTVLADAVQFVSGAARGARGRDGGHGAGASACACDGAEASTVGCRCDVPGTTSRARHHRCGGADHSPRVHVVVVDVLCRGQFPTAVASPSFFVDVSRALHVDGVCIVNADTTADAYADVVSAVCGTFSHVLTMREGGDSTAVVIVAAHPAHLTP